MTALTLISRFNRWNGNSLSIETLRNFHSEVQRCIDKDGTGPYAPTLNNMRKKVVAVINKMQEVGAEIIERADVDIIELPQVKQKEPIKIRTESLGKLNAKKKSKKVDQRKAVFAKLTNKGKLFIKDSKKKRTLKKTLQVAKKVHEKVLNETDTAKEYLKKVKPLQTLIAKGIDPLKKKQFTKSVKPKEIKKAFANKLKERLKKIDNKEFKGMGFITADKAPASHSNTFVLPGTMGNLLGTLQRYKLMIIIPGETHSSKSQLGMQLANAFAAMGDHVAWIDWEQGGLQSKDTKANIERNTYPQYRNRIHVGEVARTLQDVKDLAKKFKVIALDSGTKIKDQKNNAWIDDLREEFPDTVWIVMMQLTTDGKTRGGSGAEFDAPVVIKTYRPDQNDFKQNYAIVYKNRGNKTGTKYMMNEKQIV